MREKIYIRGIVSTPKDADVTTREGRVAAIRDASGLQPRDFASRMAELAQTLGLEATYSESKLSKLANGRQNISLDDAIVLARLDAQKRGIEWIALGDRVPINKRHPTTRRDVPLKSRREG